MWQVLVLIDWYILRKHFDFDFEYVWKFWENIILTFYWDILIRTPTLPQMRHFDLYGKFKQSKQRRLKRSHIGSWERRREAKMGHIKMPRLGTKKILLKRKLLQKRIRKDKIGWLRCIDCEVIHQVLQRCQFYRLSSFSFCGSAALNWSTRQSFPWFCNYCSDVDTNRTFLNILCLTMTSQIPQLTWNYQK